MQKGVSRGVTPPSKKNRDTPVVLHTLAALLQLSWEFQMISCSTCILLLDFSTKVVPNKMYSCWEFDFLNSGERSGGFFQFVKSA